MIPWLSFCNKYQYWNWLRHEDSLSKAELIWLFWKRGHLVSSWYIWITEMRTQSTFNHNISLSLSTIWGQEAEYIEEEGEEWCERLFCLIRDLNANVFWWYHHSDFATSINIGIDSLVKSDSVRQYWDDYFEREVILCHLGTFESWKWENNPLSIIICLYQFQQYEEKKVNI